MNTIHIHPQDYDVVLMAASFHAAALPTGPVVRLVPQPVIKAEQAALELVGLELNHVDVQQVGYAPNRTIGFPAWPMVIDPENSHHALRLVKDLDWVRKSAANQARKVAKKVEELATSLQGSVPHFLPTFYEEVARAYLAVDDQNFAKRFFAKAREVEKTHNIPIDNDRHQAAFQEFCAYGAVGPKEMSAEATSAAERMKPEQAFTYFSDLLLNEARLGHPIYANALHDLQRIAKKAPHTNQQLEAWFVSQFVPTKGFLRTTAATLNKLVPYFKAAQELNPEVRQALLAQCPERWRIADYINVLEQAGIWSTLNDDPVHCADWVVKIFENQLSDRFFDDSHPQLLAAINNASEQLKQKIITLPSQHSININLDYFNALLGAGVTITTPPGRTWGSTWGIGTWLNNGRHDLPHIYENDEARGYFLESLKPDLIAKNVDKLLSFPVSRKLVSDWLDTFAAKKSSIRYSHPLLERFCDEAEPIALEQLRELNPTAYAEIFTCNAAETLAGRLQRGTLAEYAWPKLEEILSSRPAPKYWQFYPCFPYVAVQVGSKVIAVDGDRTIEVTVPNKAEVRRVLVIEDRLLIKYWSGRNYYLWSDAPDHSYPIDSPFHGDTTGYCQQVHKIFYVGRTHIEADQRLKVIPKGYVLGTGPHYGGGDEIHEFLTILETGSDINTADFQQGVMNQTLPGLVTADLDFSVVPADATLSPSMSFCIPATETTMDSPLGVQDGTHVGYYFFKDHPTRYDRECYWISPLGSFTQKLPGLRALKRPGHGHWLLDYHKLYDAETAAPISGSLTETGESFFLNSLPKVGYHQLKLRNEQASHRLRNCSITQAEQLLKNPSEIIDFVVGDAVLAAAVAGIIAEIHMLYPILEANEWTVDDLEHPSLEFLRRITDVPQVRPVAAESFDISPELQTYLDSCFPVRRSSLPTKHISPAIIALALAEPLNTGDVLAPVWHDFYSLLSQERRILATLCSPTIPQPMVNQLVEFFTWLTEVGFLGAYAAARIDPFYAHRLPSSTWHYEVAVLRIGSYDHIAVWNPTSVDPHSSDFWKDRLKKDWPDFLPKEEFLAGLAKVASWREADDLPDDLLFHWAEAFGKATPLPAGLWRLLLYSEFSVSNDFSAATRKSLQLTATQVTQLRKFHAPFSKVINALLPAMWHEDLLESGPPVAKIAQTWETLYGTPWLKLSDADLCALAQPYIDLDRLPGILRESIPLFGYGGRNAHNIFVLLMALVPLVQPGSTEAHDLVLRLERFRNFKISEPNISIGTPYSELEKLNRYKPAPFAPIALSGGYVDRLLDYLRAGVPSNGPAENPLVSAPAIVAQAAQSLEVSEDAACYFLQLLTIAKPTNTLIKKWNSWTPRRLKAASNELLARKLVVTGQRKGAGRTVFLAGGWLHRSQAGPAMEEWKAPHYLLWPDAANQPVIPGCPPLAPYGELFTETWQRYLAGDTPEYEKLQTKHYR